MLWCGYLQKLRILSGLYFRMKFLEMMTPTWACSARCPQGWGQSCWEPWTAPCCKCAGQKGDGLSSDVLHHLSGLLHCLTVLYRWRSPVVAVVDLSSNLGSVTLFCRLFMHVSWSMGLQWRFLELSVKVTILWAILSMSKLSHLFRTDLGTGMMIVDDQAILVRAFRVKLRLITGGKLLEVRWQASGSLSPHQRCHTPWAGYSPPRTCHAQGKGWRRWLISCKVNQHNILDSILEVGDTACVLHE